MNKPTVFFSHSSKDRDLMLTIKNKLDSITGGVLDVFLSSDGQSILFGSNWVHKIEDGLRQASIMFIFVTPNSITSNWIYFEAGFAYSKEIYVIPVGVGIDIALLKAPLSLLQGFNINSSDGLNNIITVINKKFDYQFEDKFTSLDYVNIVASQTEEQVFHELSDIFDYIDYELYAEYGDGKGGKIVYDISGIFDNIVAYLVQHNIQHTYELSQNLKIILVYGIKLLYRIGIKQDEKGSIPQERLDKMIFTISPHNLEKSFDTFVHLVELISDNEWVHLKFNLKNGYSYITRQEHLASILAMYTNEFGFSENQVGTFSYKSKIKFSIYNRNRFDINKSAQYVLGISLVAKSIIYQDVRSFLYSILEKKVINKNS